MLIAIAAAAAAAISLTGGELLRLRTRWIGWTRRGETMEAFERYCVGRGYPADLARAAYLHLQRIAGVAGFPVRPTDSLADVYGLEADDVADLLCIVAMAGQCEAVSDERARSFGRLFTVEDVIRVLAPLHASRRLPERPRLLSGATRWR